MDAELERCPRTIDMFEGKRVKVSEISGDLLDYYVAIAVGAKTTNSPAENLAATGFSLQWRPWRDKPFGGLFAIVNAASIATAWKPSLIGNIAMQIIHERKIATTWAPFRGEWYALMIGKSVLEVKGSMTGPTPAVAAMRALVAAELGDEVPDAV